MTDSLTKIIGREVRAGMVRKGWTIQDLAGNLEVTPPTLSRYLRGDRDFPASVLINALRMLDVDYGEFSKRVDAAMDASVAQVLEDFRLGEGTK